MADLRTAAQAVIDRYDNALEIDTHCDLADPIEALRQALAKPEPSVDALIAEIDGLGVHTFPNQSSEEFVRLKKLKGIMDKYRGQK